LRYEREVKDAYDGPLFEGPLTVSIDLFVDRSEITLTEIDSEKAALAGDVDNYAKSHLDALNGVAYIDDRQVYELRVEKHPRPS
jgi:Holliday junction resolvase RusA-like endonuclease